MAELQVLVKRKQAYKVTVSEGWFSEQEMRDELGWKEWGALEILLLIKFSIIAKFRISF